MQIHWHRRDLRGPDNVGLAAAASSGPVVPVFVVDDAVLEYAGAPRVRFLLDALGELRSWYRDRGSDLLVARGDPRSVLPSLARAVDADRVTWNRDVSGLARERDDAVEDALAGAGVDCASFDDALLHGPGSILTNVGETYSVYSYFWKKWRDRPKDDPVPAPEPGDLLAGSDVVAAAESVDGAAGETADAAGSAAAETEAGASTSGSNGPIPPLGAIGFEEPSAALPDAGYDAARDRLDAFCAGPIFRYAADRDFPAREGTSRLSVDLSFGTIGVREVYRATEAAMAATERAGAATAGAGAATVEDAESAAEDAESAAEDAAESIEEFRSQLAWREFYAHVLADRPDVVRNDFREYERGVAWRTDPAGLRAWKDGRTGFPIVDAGMRQLRAEAYVHNRVRMIVASFLTKDLLVDWREGYAWFRERLVDHDPANDSGGWQWAASTGTDAQPYFRVFNPWTQGERYDPEATYVRRYVPELTDVDQETIHSWDELSPGEREALAPEYPAPIVDHAARREAALAAFEAARGETPRY